jgi:hypothetical protein
MSSYEVRDNKGQSILREEEIYNWITKNDTQCNYVAKPFEFVQKIKNAAEAYTLYANGKNIDGSRNIYLENIKNLGGGSFSQHLILLLPAKELEPINFDKLARNIETLIMYYTITRTSTKEFERKFSAWAKEINAISAKEGDEEAELLDAFISTTLGKETAERESDFKVGFLNLRYDSLQMYKLRYVLGKITQYVDDQRLGRETIDSMDAYIANKIEIEHILPNTPTQELIAVIGNEDEYNVYKLRLGNLTLLEKPHNVVVGREFFEKKLPIYAQSHFYLTRSIAKLEDIGLNTSVTRINSKLKSYDTWNKETIDQRQEELYGLSTEVWSLN